MGYKVVALLFRQDVVEKCVLEILVNQTQQFVSL